MSAIIDAILGSEKIGIEPIAYESDGHTCTTDREKTVSVHQIGIDGTLTSLEIVNVNDSVSPDKDVYVRVSLLDDQNTERGTLFRGYLDSSSNPFGNGAKPVKATWMFRIETFCSMETAPLLVLRGTFLSKKRQCGGWTCVNEDSLSGSGKIKISQASDPSSGSEFRYTVDSNTASEIIAVRFRFLTSSTVANRYVGLSLDNSTDIMVNIPAQQGQTASLPWDYNFCASGYSNEVGEQMGGVVNMNTALPNLKGAFLDGTWRIGSSTTNISGGDTFSTIIIWHKQYLKQG